MSDHEFEKKVQQKMDELRLRPSNAVWTEVEKNLRGEKRRRRVLLWLPLIGVLLTAGGYFIFTGDRGAQETALANKPATEKAAAPVHSNSAVPATTAPLPSTKDNISSTEQNELSLKNATLSSTKQNEASSNNASLSSTEQNTPSSKNATHSDINKKAAPAASVINPAYNGIVKPKSNIVKEKEHKIVTEHNDQMVGRKNNGQPEMQKENEKAATPLEAANPAGVAPKQAVKNEPPALTKDSAKAVIDSSAIVSNIVSDDSTALAVAAIDSTQKTVDKAIAKTPAKKKKSAAKFQWGVTAGAGVANISEGSILDMLQSVRVDDFTNTSAQYFGIPPAPAPQPSPIRPGPVFSVGGYVQTNLSKRIVLSVGLQYNYWTVNTKIGKRVDSVVTVNTGNSSAQLTSAYFRADTKLRDYTNEYHLIAVPVTASFQLTKSKKTPLVLDAGVSLARLMNTNALHFDGINRVYYENDDFFNKLQVSLNTGINIGFLQGSKHPVWVGPGLRYFATGLIKKELSSNATQHLWSFGVNARMLLKK